MPLGEIYVKLSVTFADDPKVRALARYGVDGILARDLYVQMILHCKRLLTDGFVSADQIGLLSYPLPADHANQLAKQLASVGLTKEVSNPEANDKQGWEVCAFVKRNGTKEDVERLSEVRAQAGRAGGIKSRKRPAQRPSKASGKQVGNQDAKQNSSNTVSVSVGVTPNGLTPTDDRDLQTPTVSAETPSQRANRLAKIYTDRVRVSNFPAVAAIVRKAVDADCTDEHIERGLHKVADENRSLTTESLRVAMYGPPKERSTSEDRARQALDAATEAAAMLREGTGS